jgi:hypothetical protein
MYLKLWKYTPFDCKSSVVLDLRRWIMKPILTAAVAAALFSLSACGTSTSDRALSGGGIGAAVGVVGGALVGAPLAGAVIGGAVGAGAGALTSPNQVYLGKPVWRR